MLLPIDVQGSVGNSVVTNIDQEDIPWWDL